MQLTILITDPWAQAASQTPEQGVADALTQCPLLARADWVLASGRPGANLYASSSPEPTAMLHSVLSPDAQATWCLLPVHLSMQRDSFSLQSILSVNSAVYTTLGKLLRQHFADDFEVFPDPELRCWWIRPLQPLAASMPWPQDCLFQSAFAWQAQGPDGATVRQWSNEIQMLLHQLAAQPPVSGWPDALNSLWFANVIRPQAPVMALQSVVLGGQGRLYDGWLVSQGFTERYDRQDLFEPGQSARECWYIADTHADVPWQALTQAMMQGRVKHLQLSMPYAERQVTAVWQYAWRWQCWQARFWRKPHTPLSLAAQLSAALPSQLTMA